MNLRVFDDYEALSAGIAEELARRIEATDSSLVLLTGGDTPRRAYELLGADPLRARIASRPVIWVPTDERVVPPEDPESNARMIRETLFRRGIPQAHRFVPFRTELGEPERIAAELEAELREVLGERAVDLAVLGVGADGHTASLFPGTDVLEETERWARAVLVPRLDAWRVTLTFPFLARAAERWVLASGAAKRDVIEQVRAGADLPIARASESGSGWWFVDRAAWDPEAPREGARR